MTTIYLIRHGQASFGEENYDKLSKRGRQQAQVLGQHLKQILTAPPLVLSGSMQRHKDTAAISMAECFPEIMLHQQPYWNEFDHQQVFARYDPQLGSPARLKAAMEQSDDSQRYLTEVFYAAMQRWSQPVHAQDYDECWTKFNARIQLALLDVLQRIEQEPTQTVLVFSSGGVISSLIGHVLGLETAKTFELNWAISNCSMSSLKFDYAETLSRLKLMSLNEYHFLTTADPKLASWM